MHFLGGFAAGNLIVRVFADLLLARDAVVIPVLLSRLVLEAATIGWLLGWGLLGAAVFLTAPRIFPRQLLAWAQGLPGRTILTLGSVATAFLTNSLLGTLEGGVEDV